VSRNIPRDLASLEVEVPRRRLSSKICICERVPPSS
jgi:hypothetical protein